MSKPMEDRLLEKIAATEEENVLLKERLAQAEQVAYSNGLAQQELLELLVDMEVI